MDLEPFAELALDGQHGVQRRHRLLEDHGDLPAAHATHLLLVQRQEIAALEEHLPTDDASGRRRHQPHDAEGRDALAAPRLAHQRDRLARVDVPGDIVDGAYDAGAGLELRAQVSDVEEDRHRSEEHTSELQSLAYLVCRLLLEKKKQMHYQ